jgi:hypothetical protein
MTSTPNPQLPEPDERVRNRCHAQLPRARTAQLNARLKGDNKGEAWATADIDRWLDDLLSIRKPHGLR